MGTRGRGSTSRYSLFKSGSRSFRDAKEFHLAEFKLLREEINRRSQEQLNSEQYTVLGSVAIYVFLGTYPETDLALGEVEDIVRLIWFLPFALVIFGSARWWSSHKNITLIAEYLRDYEERVDPERKGWETLIESKRKGPLHTQVFWRVPHAYMILALIFTAWLAIWPLT
jgi:hypothetical protein